MAVVRAVGSQSTFIDLTGSDDEEDLMPSLYQRPVDPENFKSHDGLPNLGAILPPTRPPSNILRPQPATQSTRMYEHGSSAPRRSLANVVDDAQHPAKRRKTDTGPLLQQHRRPILPPIPTHMRPVPTPPAMSTMKDRASREESVKSVRVTPRGRIQKPLPSTQQCKLDETARIVRGVLLKHKNVLPAGQLKLIGQKVFKQLLDPSFFVESTKDAQQLCPDYLIVLTRRTQDYTDNMVEKALRSRSSSPRNILLQTQVPAISSSLSQSVPKYRPRSSVRSDSSDVEEIFEVRRHPVPNRNLSSSPATSLDQTGDIEHKVANTGDRAEHLGQIDKPTKRVKLKPSLWDKFSAPAVYQPLSAKDRKLPVVEISSYKPSKFKGVINCEADSPITIRPYRSYQDREALRLGFEGIQVMMSPQEQENLKASTIHHDFSLEELKIVYIIAKGAKGEAVTRVNLEPTLPMKIIDLLAGASSKLITTILDNLRKTCGSGDQDKGIELLRDRGHLALKTFLQDVVTGKLASSPQIHRLDVKAKRKTAMRLSTLLLQREVSGLAPSRISAGKESFRSRVTSLFEDDVVRQSEWTDCCGDISTITWTSKNAFICGATAHSDHHNMQYNKPGNLVVGSTTFDTLKSVSNHRIKRPKIAREENAENALQSMRNTQDAWLYTSVVSTAYSPMTELAFTASFDQTVKVWAVPQNGSQMGLRDAWYHPAKVNFVVTSKHHNRVATACDVSLDSIRVYTVDPNDITTSANFDSYCGERARAQAQAGPDEKWAYFPATIQWGKTENVSHLLLVGFSPRGLTGDDQDIPEDRRDTGELCLWDVNTGEEINITSAKLQNVFEVLWHPNQPIFLAATSPCGAFEPWQTKTQIRMFGQTSNGTFIHIKALDCPAMDINELTIFPNSRLHSYVTASCTDGNTYVYDSAISDQAIHILNHGESLDNPLHDIDREQGDTGVKFAAWGQNKTRFYTGASDGKVKAWNITAPPQHAFVKDVLVVAGGVSAGAFSEDYSQLLIGDATGKIHLLSIDDSDVLEPAPSKPEPLNPLHARGRHLLQHGGLLPSGLKRPKVVIPHPEPAPPIEHNPLIPIPEEQTGPEISRQLIQDQIIQVHPDPWIGAIQGDRYLESNLFRYEAHENSDGTAPLLPEWQAKQRSFLYTPSQRDLQVSTLKPVPLYGSDLDRHRKNLQLDLNFESLSLETKTEILMERWEIEGENVFEGEISPGEGFEIFKTEEEEGKEGSGKEEEEDEREIEGLEPYEVVLKEPSYRPSAYGSFQQIFTKSPFSFRN